MNDVSFIVCFLAAAFTIGFIISSKLGDIRAVHLLAPVIGFAAVSVMATVLYRYGVPAQMVTFVIAGVAMLSAALTWRRYSVFGNRGAAVFLAGIAGLALLALLPRWTGGENFYAYQINPYDQINYFQLSSAVRTYSFSEIVHPASPSWNMLANSTSFVTWAFEARPAVIIVHAVATWPFFATTIDGYYAYMAALQVLMALSATFLIAQFSRASLWVALLLGAAFALGPLFQHVIDLNAWSQSAAMPVAFAALALGILLMLSEKPNVWLLAAFAICLSGVIYLYPEILSICLAGGLGAVIANTWQTRQLRTLVYPALACVVALGVAALCWQGTLGFGLSQAGAASQPLLDWAVYYDRQLLGRDVPYATIFLLAQMPLGAAAIYAFASMPIDLGFGALGLYYLLPTAGWPIALRVVWKLAAAAYLLTLVAAVFLSIRSLSDKERILVWGFTGCLAVPALAGLDGLFWTAGKALGMASPGLYILAVLPLVTATQPRWIRLPSALVVLAAIAFAFARPIAAANPSGTLYPHPYPSFEAKPQANWKIAKHAAQLRSCRNIHLDIDNPFLDTYLQVALTDMGVGWTSLRPIRPYYGMWPVLQTQPHREADCLIADNPQTAGTTYRWVLNPHR